MPDLMIPLQWDPDTKLGTKLGLRI